MTLPLKSIILSAVLAGTFVTASAMPDTDNKTRQQPKLEAGDNNASSGSHSYIDYKANNIIMNGRNWSSLARALSQSSDQQKQVSIVHIGDSHIQAEGATTRIRAALQKRFGNAGRGLMIPFKIAGTNQPQDYRITLDSPATTATMMRMPWPTTMGFTGVSVAPRAARAQFSVKPETDFSTLIVYGRGDYAIESVTNAGNDIDYKVVEVSPGVKSINFNRPLREARINIKGTGYNIFGFDAHADSKTGGLIYSAIGNNGATYQTYLKVGNVGKSLVNMHPSLVIISLGANEAFGNITDQGFYSNIDKLVNEIKSSNPNAEILLTTPSECQRSSYVTSTTPGTKRKRSSTQRIRTYQINTNVARLRNVILKYGRDKGVPVYDFYAVAGGEGSSAKWLADGLLSSDRIHRTWAGYRTEGDLMADALSRALVAEGGAKGGNSKVSKGGNIRTQTPDANHKNRDRKYSTKAKANQSKK